MSLSRQEYDVPCLVVGGGPAGYGAAAAALRGGCETILVERHGFLGGMSTAAGLSCYLNHLGEGTDLSAPVYRAFIRQQAGRNSHYHDDWTQADFFEPESCKQGMEQSLLAAGGHLLYHALLQGIYREGSAWVAEFLSKGCRIRVRSQYVIDATGDADACALAGAELTHGLKSNGKTQPMTMVVQLGGFNPADWQAAGYRLVQNRYAAEGDHFAKEVAHARQAGQWSIPRENIALFWALPQDPTRIAINGTRISGFNACNPSETTLAEIEGRRQAGEILSFFKHYVPGFKNAYLLQTGPQIGVRESRRIVGRQTLTEADVCAGTIPANSIMLCAYPIDVHAPEGIGTRYEAGPRVYGIPWECQLPLGLDNVAAAGRCISATHEAAGSFRVMPTCMGLGEAAGTAAALAHSRQVQLHQIRSAEIRDEMDKAYAAANECSPWQVFTFSENTATANA